MPIRMDGLAGPEIRRKVEALEERAKWSADSRLVEERLLRCEAECREQRIRMDASKMRTLGLDYPALKRTLDSLGAFVHQQTGELWKARDALRGELTRALAAKMQHHEEKVFPRIRALEPAPFKDAQLEAKFVELEQRLIGGFDALVDQTVKWQDQNVAARRPVNQELGELRARVQELEAASCVYEGSLAFHDERLEKLEAK
jgi:hypothetical protein